MKKAVATFAAGCFWGVEADFAKVEGVLETQVGYTGGHFKDPSYEDVLTDTTGHAESVEVSYDEDVLSYVELLKVFFELHNPSTIPGEKYKYRSTLFYHTPEQEETARGFLKELKEAKLYDLSVKTTIVKAREFYRAEEYHQCYYEKMGILESK